MAGTSPAMTGSACRVPAIAGTGSEWGPERIGRAGENILESMSNIVPALSWLIPVPFYFMELLVGIVQAMVFMLLTAVFTLLICQHEEEGHH